MYFHELHFFFHVLPQKWKKFYFSLILAFLLLNNVCSTKTTDIYQPIESSLIATNTKNRLLQITDEGISELETSLRKIGVNMPNRLRVRRHNENKTNGSCTCSEITKNVTSQANIIKDEIKKFHDLMKSYENRVNCSTNLPNIKNSTADIRDEDVNLIQQGIEKKSNAESILLRSNAPELDNNAFSDEQKADEPTTTLSLMTKYNNENSLEDVTTVFDHSRTVNEYEQNGIGFSNVTKFQDDRASNLMGINTETNSNISDESNNYTYTTAVQERLLFTPIINSDNGTFTKTNGIGADTKPDEQNGKTRIASTKLAESNLFHITPKIEMNTENADQILNTNIFEINFTEFSSLKKENFSAKIYDYTTCSPSSNEPFPPNTYDTETPIPEYQYTDGAIYSEIQNKKIESTSTAKLIELIDNSNDLRSNFTLINTSVIHDIYESAIKTEQFTISTDGNSNTETSTQSKNNSSSIWKRVCFQNVQTLQFSLNQHNIIQPTELEPADMYLYYYIPSMSDENTGITNYFSPVVEEKHRSLKHEFILKDQNVNDKKPYSAFSLDRHKILSSYHATALKANKTILNQLIIANHSFQPYKMYENTSNIPNPNIKCIFLPINLTLTSSRSNQDKIASHETQSKTKNTAFPKPRILSECTDHDKTCADGSGCIKQQHWCDGIVDCPDLSDELHCSCKDRMDINKICDGYFDCPDGADEKGCAGCPENMFVCDTENHLATVCFDISNRCDNIHHCRDGKDEKNCEILTDSIDSKEFLTSYTTGYLHRNWKGNWYPVCEFGFNNDWAVKACSSELGFYVKHVDVESIPYFKYSGNFVLGSKNALNIQFVDHCNGNYAIHVKCPPIPCGTRVLHEYFNSSYRARRKTEENLKTKDTDFKAVVDILNYIFAHNGSNITKKTHKVMHHIDLNISRDSLEDGQPSGERVVGGEFSYPGYWPWLVMINKDGKFHCGGVILDETWIMTAAHCVHRFSQYYYDVRAGVLRRRSFSPTEQVRYITHVITHPAYESTVMKNDLALLKLNAPLMFNRWVRPICLPEPRPPWGPLPGSRCTAVGWGTTKEHGLNPDNLKEVDLPILPACKNSIDNEGEEICAGDLLFGGKDTCQGDSGGPLLCKIPIGHDRWYVAGVVSHGEGCARPNEPGAYTRVALFLPWLVKNTDDKFLLSNLRPKQQCPSLQCKRGSQCIHHNNICDRVIDCLDAEDEVECLYTQNENVDNIYIPEGYADFKSIRNSGIQADLLSSQVQNISILTHRDNTDEDESISQFNDIVKNDAEIPLLKTSDGYFNCSILFQKIPSASYCDGEIDCEDATDEMGCSCSDILRSENSSYICDGVIDCYDSSDETNCSDLQCSEEEFYCYHSRTCISRHLRCDSQRDCLNGEDERNCYAVIPIHAIGRNIQFNIFGVPAFAEKGVLAHNKRGVWEFICFPEENSTEKQDSINKITKQLGFKSYKNYEKIITMKGDLLHLNVSNIDYCSGVKINFQCAKYIDDEINLPWRANIFINGELKCSGLLVNSEWIVLEYDCCNMYNTTADYMVAVFRSNITMKTKSFHEQIIRIDYIKCNKRYSIAHLEKLVDITEHSRELCSSSDIAVEMKKHNQHEMYNFLHNNAKNISKINSNSCNNGFRCELGNCISWFAVCDGKPDCRENEDETEMGCKLKDDVCKKNATECTCKIHQFRCRNDGKCISKSAICDGNKDCTDGSDEPEKCSTFTCATYLNLTNPENLCNARQDCFDKSDEQYEMCNSLCHLPSSFNCTTNECIPMDFMCDGEQDCLNGEDERNCTYFHNDTHQHKNEGTIFIRSNGQWHPECITQDFTTFDVEKLCVQFGFENVTHLEMLPGFKNFSNPFINIKLNEHNSVKIRHNTHNKMTVTEPCNVIHLNCE